MRKGLGEAEAVADERVAELSQRLEEGIRDALTSDGWKRFLNVQAAFHNYSWGNVLLIAVQRPDATRVAGFQTWKKLGRYVRRGEKGIAILAPIVAKRRVGTEEPQGPDGIAEFDGEELHEKRVIGFKIVHVFDVSQTDGDQLPEQPMPVELEVESETGGWLGGRLLDVAQKLGLCVLPGSPGDKAYGSFDAATKTIRLRPGLAADQRAKTLCHEIAHAILNHRGTFDVAQYAEQEAAAEGTAYVVCSRFGLPTDGYSFNYVAGWAGKVDGMETVKRVAGAVQRTAAAVIDAIGGAEKGSEAA